MEKLRAIFGVEKPLIAMCHLRGLPGRPRHDAAAGIDGVVEALARDVDALQGAGVDGLLFCNENDIPYQLEVGPEIVAAMASAIGRIRSQIRLPFGVDILWDARAALAVARATGAVFLREVLTGAFESDLGVLAPNLGDLAAYRQAIGAQNVALFTNITPEFARSIANRSIEERAKGAAFLGVDAILISGQAAGVEASMDELRAAKSAVDIPVLANTGVNHDNVQDMLRIGDGVIVGTNLKVDGNTWNPVDPERARRMVQLVARTRSLARAG